MNNQSDSPQELQARITKLETEIRKIQDQYDRIIHYLIRPTQNSGMTASVVDEPKIRPQNTSPLQPQKPNASPAPRSSDGATYLLPFIAVICFVLAGVFLVKLSIDSGWLTTERQWGLLGLLGVVLTSLGRFFTKIEKAERTYLSAAGIIVLYLAAYSSALYFQIFPQQIALVLAMAVSLICLGLFRFHQSELFTVITSIGTYLSPLLLEASGELLFNSQFFIIWAFLFSFLASFLRTRVLSLTAAYLGLGVFTLLYSSVTDPDQLKWIISVNVIQFFAFAFGVYSYSLRNKSVLSQKEALAYLPILLFFYGTTYFFLNKLDATFAPWISLGFAGFVYLLYFRVKSQLNSLNSQPLVHGFLGVVLFHSGYLQILPEYSKPWLLPILILMMHVSENKAMFPKVSEIMKLGFGAIGFIEFGKICLRLFNTNRLEDIFPAVITVGLGIFYYLKGSARVKGLAELFLGLVHLLSILALYRILFQYGSFAVSLGWALYGGMILGLGFMKKDAAMAKSSLLVLLITSLKALIYDASQAPSGVRILSLLLTGAALYTSGIFLKKIKTWDRDVKT